VTDRNYGAVKSAARFTKFVDTLITAGKPIGFDIESGYTGVDKEKVSLLPFHPDWIMVGFSFTNSTEWARYVPLQHDDPRDNTDDLLEVARQLWRLLNSGLGVAHNFSFELQAVSRFFRETLWDDPFLAKQVRASNGLYPFLADSMLVTWLTDSYDPLRVGKGLKGLTKHVFDHTMVEFMDLFPEQDSEFGPGTPKSKRKYVRFNTRHLIPAVVNYACEDALWCLALYEKDRVEVERDMSLILRTETALQPVLAEMEQEGMLLDWTMIHSKAEETALLRDEMNEEILAELSRRLDEPITVNLGSPKQLGDLLFGKLGLPVKIRSEKTNAPSTSEEALRAIAKADPIMKRLLEWREVQKLFGSYLDKYDTQLNYAGTGRAHPNHNQAGAGTGRLSVDGVSYQQWPKPYKYSLANGRKYYLNYRDLLISPPGRRIVGYDFSQVELRVLAGMAQETGLLKAFADGTDVHRATASIMKKIPLDQVTKKDRAQGKTLNFAVVYGSGAANIAELLTTPENPVTTEDAQAMLDDYFAGFSKLRGWMDQQIADARGSGYTKTLFGRKQKIWEYESRQNWLRAKGDRYTVNSIVQGGAADYMKIGMVRVSKVIKKAEADGLIPVGSIRLIMTIHDALEFYVSDEVSTQTVINLVQPAVSFPVAGLPEIRADWHEGDRWGSVIEIELDKNKQISGYSYEGVTGETYEFATLEEAKAHWDEHQPSSAVWKPADSKVERISEAESQVGPNGENWGVLAAAHLSDPDPIGQVSDAELDDTITTANDDIPMAFTRPSDATSLVGRGDLMDLATEPAPKVKIDPDPSWAHRPDHDPGKQIIVTIMEMPTAEEYAKFTEFEGTKRGSGSDPMLVLQTPEGTIEVTQSTTITQHDQPLISLLLGGATVHEGTSTVSMDELTDGIDL
jgi:DNA polymerase I-like protein with 3'-5' exonuclease and polymerase domains